MSEWNKFSDKQPKPYEYILVSNGHVVTECLFREFCNGWPIMSGLRYIDGGFDQYIWERKQGGMPQYWMKMPEPPGVYD